MNPTGVQPALDNLLGKPSYNNSILKHFCSYGKRSGTQQITVFRSRAHASI